MYSSTRYNFRELTNWKKRTTRVSIGRNESASLTDNNNDGSSSSSGVSRVPHNSTRSKKLSDEETNCRAYSDSSEDTDGGTSVYDLD